MDDDDGGSVKFADFAVGFFGEFDVGGNAKTGVGEVKIL